MDNITECIIAGEVELRWKTKSKDLVRIASSHDAYQYALQLYDPGIMGIREEFNAIFLNRNNKVVAWSKISQGGVSGTVVDIRFILKTVLDIMASAVILCHNHPSGNIQPSEADLSLTMKIKNACAYFDIQVIDSLILSDEKYYSFADEGRL